MKKHLLLTVNLLLLVSLFAQKPSLTKAYNCFYDKDYDKAKVQIDLCAADEKLSAKAQTWLYKGNIEFLMYLEKSAESTEFDILSEAKNVVRLSHEELS